MLLLGLAGNVTSSTEMESMGQGFTTYCILALAVVGAASASSAGGGSGSGGGSGAGAPVKAVLFDFDGSLVQSEEHHRLSFSAVLGVELDRETWYSKCVGRRPLSILQEFRPPDAAPAEELALRLVEDAVGRYDAVEATAGHLELLSDVGAYGLRTAIVSSSTRAYIERVLARLELAERFELIVAGDDPQIEGKHKVAARTRPRPRVAPSMLVSKRASPSLPSPCLLTASPRPYSRLSVFQPHPFPYLHAAEVLGVSPEHCIAVEDSPAGITSALRAGMRVIAIRNPANRDLPILNDALVVALIDDFHELPRAVFGCVVASAPVLAPSAES
jgi:beta-phosphoglucomutase-like phosphatase (HAD superfamily)